MKPTILFIDVATGLKVVMTNKNKSGTKKTFTLQDSNKNIFFEHDNPIIVYKMTLLAIEKLESNDPKEVRQ